MRGRAWLAKIQMIIPFGRLRGPPEQSSWSPITPETSPPIDAEGRHMWNGVEYVKPAVFLANIGYAGVC